MATLKLKRALAESKVADESPPLTKSPDPVFDKEGYFVMDISMGGTLYIQGRHVFTAGGKYLREIPDGDAPAALTPEQERNFIRDKLKNKKFFGKAKGPAGEIPAEVKEALRENARALAAEEQAC